MRDNKNFKYFSVPEHQEPTPVIPLSKTGSPSYRYQQPLITALYFIGTLVLFIQSLVTNKYNNFIIFRSSWDHMLHHQPLYLLYPDTYFDYYLYHPSFPVFFAPIAILPKAIGLFVWLIGSTWLFLYAIRQIPVKASKHYIICWLLILELLNAIQSSQTNPVMTALMILTVVNMDRKKPVLAALFTCLCFFIKGYGAIIGLLFLFFDKKWAYLKYCIIFGIAGTLLPLVVLTPTELLQSYKDWYGLITSSTIVENVSLRGMMHAIGHVPQLVTTPADMLVFITAVIGLVAAFISGGVYKPAFYQWIIGGYLLIWIVVFNQSSESPTYILAATGAVAGLMLIPEKKLPVILLGLLILVTSLFPTDLVPKFINRFAVAYHLKVLPCVLILLYFQYYLFTRTKQQTS